MLAFVVSDEKPKKDFYKYNVVGARLVDMATQMCRQVGLTELQNLLPRITNIRKQDNRFICTECSIQRMPIYSATSKAYFQCPVPVVAKLGDNSYLVLDSRGIQCKADISKLESLNCTGGQGLLNVKITRRGGTVVVSSIVGKLPVISNNTPKVTTNKPDKGTSSKKLKRKQYLGLVFENKVISLFDTCNNSRLASMWKLTESGVNLMKEDVRKYPCPVVTSMEDIRTSKNTASAYNSLLYLPFILGDNLTSQGVVDKLHTSSALDKFVGTRVAVLNIDNVTKEYDKLKSRYAEKVRLLKLYTELASRIEDIRKVKSLGGHLSNEEFTLLKVYTDGGNQGVAEYLDYRKNMTEAIKQHYLKVKAKYDCTLPKNQILLPFFNGYVRRGKVDFVLHYSDKNPYFEKLGGTLSEFSHNLDRLVLITFALRHAEGAYPKFSWQENNNSSLGTFKDYILYSAKLHCKDIVPILKTILKNKRGCFRFD
jgi:hypothetical protein